jgi:hypothetical protein
MTCVVRLIIPTLTFRPSIEFAGDLRKLLFPHPQRLFPLYYLQVHYSSLSGPTEPATMSTPYDSARRVRVLIFADTINVELVGKLGLSDTTLQDLRNLQSQPYALLASGEPTIHNVRFESPTDRMFSGETGNSFTSVSLEVEVLDIEVTPLLAIVTWVNGFIFFKQSEQTAMIFKWPSMDRRKLATAH